MTVVALRSFVVVDPPPTLGTRAPKTFLHRAVPRQPSCAKASWPSELPNATKVRACQGVRARLSGGGWPGPLCGRRGRGKRRLLLAGRRAGRRALTLTAMFCSAWSTVEAALVNWLWTGVRSMLGEGFWGMVGEGGHVVVVKRRGKYVHDFSAQIACPRRCPWRACSLVASCLQLPAPCEPASLVRAVGHAERAWRRGSGVTRELSSAEPPRSSFLSTVVGPHPPPHLPTSTRIPPPVHARHV